MRTCTGNDDSGLKCLGSEWLKTKFYWACNGVRGSCLHCIWIPQKVRISVTSHGGSLIRRYLTGWCFWDLEIPDSTLLVSEASAHSTIWRSAGTWLSVHKAFQKQWRASERDGVQRGEARQSNRNQNFPSVRGFNPCCLTCHQEMTTDKGQEPHQGQPRIMWFRTKVLEMLVLFLCLQNS